MKKQLKLEIENKDAEIVKLKQEIDQQNELIRDIHDFIAE